jgi:anti-sigma regulatory factor (Ser/Thr protein kinase)
MTRQTFSPEVDQVPAARFFARSVAQSFGCAPEEAGLVVSELATNACQHAQTPYEVSVERHGSTLMVEVADESLEPIAESIASISAERGRGLHIVALIARSWGVRLQPPRGKLIWAELDCQPR